MEQVRKRGLPPLLLVSVILRQRDVIVITFSRFIFLVLVCLLLSSCSRSSPTPPSQPGPNQPPRWLLLVAPKLLPDDCEKSEPCTGTPYVRAPYADWTKE